MRAIGAVLAVVASLGLAQRGPAPAVQESALRPLSVRVIDARTRQPLSGVRVARAEDEAAAERDHPGVVTPERLLVRSARSPVAVPRVLERFDEEVVWIGADGYAWSRLEVGMDAAVERVVELVPGGAPVMKLAGEPIADAVVRIDPLPPIEEILAVLRPSLAALAELRGEDVVPSAEEQQLREQVARIERRDPAAHAVVRARKTAAVELAVVPPEFPERVAVAGTLHVPPEWGADPITVALRALRLPHGAPKPVAAEAPLLARPIEGEPGRFAFDAGMRLPGDYELVLAAFGIAQPFAVLVGEEGLWPATPGRATATPARADFTFRVPQGQVAFRIEAAADRICEQQFLVGEGRNELTLRLRPKDAEAGG